MRHLLTPLLTTGISSYFKNRPRIPIRGVRNRTGAPTDIFNLSIFDRQEVEGEIELAFSPRKKSKIITFSSTDSPRLLIVYMSIDSNATTNRSNSIMRDSRRIVGSIVDAKAIHVTNNAECGRRYGRNKTTKLVQGHVAEVQNGQSATGRSQCFLACDFDFGEGVSVKEKAEHPVRKIGSAFGGYKFQYSGPKFRNQRRRRY